ncbi:MAG: HAD family hydrolase [Nanoarchaeota archaeon]
MEALIFDWSGTIYDNVQDFYTQFVVQMFQLHNKTPISFQEFQENFTIPYMRFWNKYFPTLTKEEQNALYKKLMPHDCGKPYPDVGKTLSKLREKGIRMFVVSSDSGQKMMHQAQEHGLSDFFEETYCDIYDKDKKLMEIMQTHTLRAKQTAYMGDTIGDIEAAHAAGVISIAHTQGFQHRAVLQNVNPDFCIDRFGQLLDLIDQKKSPNPFC